MADLWSDYSDEIIKSLDRQISAKYKLTLRGFLTDPTKFAVTPNIQTTIENLKEEVNSYIDKKANDMVPEKRAFEDAAMRADALTTQLGQTISVQARQNSIPIIKPILFERDTDEDEHIYVDAVDNGIISLVSKLIASSTYVLDSTAAYGNYKVGEWLFSSSKNYLISVYLPSNGYFVLQTSRDEIIGLLNSASAALKGL